MKKQMKSSIFTAVLGLALTGVMLSSSTQKVATSTANQLQPMHGLQFPASAPMPPTSVPFTAYLSLLTAFTNGKTIDFNTMDEEGQSSIWDKMTNWREEQ